MSQVGMAKKDIPRMLPVSGCQSDGVGKGGSLCPSSSLGESYPPEQNAEAVMPTVWAMRMAGGMGRGAIGVVRRDNNNKLMKT